MYRGTVGGGWGGWRLEVGSLASGDGKYRSNGYLRYRIRHQKWGWRGEHRRLPLQSYERKVLWE